MSAMHMVLGEPHERDESHLHKSLNQQGRSLEAGVDAQPWREGAAYSLTSHCLLGQLSDTTQDHQASSPRTAACV